MPSHRGSLSSIHSLSVPLSVKNQTKGKFDALLKKSLKTNLSASKEKLLNDLESSPASTDNLLDKEPDRSDLLKELTLQNESYIMQKFLGQSSKNLEETELKSLQKQSSIELVTLKPPVPKPRTKKNVSPTLSQGTFEVTSPKIVKKQDESSSSNETYNIEEIGDVLVNNNAAKPKIIKKTVKLKKEKNVKSESVDQTSSESETPQYVSPKKTRKDSIKFVDETTRETDTDVRQTKIYTYEKILEIIVHKTDRLQLSSLVVHPMVKIHFIDAATGKYFPKSDKSRSVVFFYENDKTDYISPIMTHACNLQEKRILYPSWEETILINEDYEYIKKESSRIILFFEVLDFLSFGLLNQINDCTNGWHNMAFAFLKLSGKDGSLNIGKKVRLQLYYSCQTKKTTSQTCHPWIWWKKKKLKKYPSTLHITIKPVVSPTKITESFRSKAPMQQESSKIKFDDGKCAPAVNPEFVQSTAECSTPKNESVKWSRRSNEVCKLPNKCLVEFSSYDEGCFVMKFSSSGIYLACAVEIENLFYIVIYSVLTLGEVNKFSCHQALIYDIKWSHDDSLLVLASADNTVSVFNTASFSLFQVLPHPSFVYSCDINKDNTIATGCFDGTIRIWQQIPETNTEFHLFQEIKRHSGYVTSLCFSKNSSIFSADSTGEIYEWRQEGVDWVLKREIKLLNLKETIINHILLFPKERRLLVQSRDSVIRIIDIKSGCVLHWLRGGLNKRFRIFSTISPCGTFLYSGSENGFIHVWNSKNGLKVATYVPFNTDSKFLTIHCVEFHPYDNLLAISHYGKKVPILLYCVDPTLQEPTVKIEVIEENYLILNLESSRSETFKQYAKKKSENTGAGRIDFKGVLEKMDLVIHNSNT